MNKKCTRQYSNIQTIKDIEVHNNKCVKVITNHPWVTLVIILITYNTLHRCEN